MCWADAPRYRNPPQACSFYTHSNLSPEFEGLGLSHFAFEGLEGVEIGWSGGRFQKLIPKAPCRLMLTCPSASAGAAGAKTQFPADDRRS